MYDLQGTPFAMILLASVLVLGAVASPACTDWTEASPVPLSASWNGSTFLGTGIGQVRDGFLLKQRLTNDGGEPYYRVALFHIQDPTDPVTVHSWSGHDDGWSTIDAAAGDRCILGVGGSGGFARRLVTVDASGVITDVFMPWHGVADLAGDRAFQLGESYEDPGVACIDLTDPASPALLGSLAGDFHFAPFALDANRVLVIESGLIRLIDFTDPAAPQSRGSASASLSACLGRLGNLVFVSGPDGTYALDVSDPDDLQFAWWHMDRASALAVQGDVAVLGFATTSLRLEIYDFTSGTGQPLGGAFGGAYGKTLDWSGNVLYTGTGQAWDLADVLQPELLGVAASFWEQSYVDGDLLVMPTGLVPTHCAVTAVDTAPAPLLSVSAHPNPFNPSTVVTYELAESGPVLVTVHDQRGALVRTLASGVRDAGRHQTAWNGCDESGLTVAAGVYMIRVTSRTSQLMTKTTLLE